MRVASATASVATIRTNLPLALAIRGHCLKSPRCFEKVANSQDLTGQSLCLYLALDFGSAHWCRPRPSAGSLPCNSLETHTPSSGGSRTSKREDPHTKKCARSARKIRATPTLTSTRPLFVPC